MFIQGNTGRQRESTRDNHNIRESQDRGVEPDPEADLLGDIPFI